MASSMIHLAITQCMTKEIEFKNLDRIRLGSILPDGAISGNSHLKKKIFRKENRDWIVWSGAGRKNNRKTL